uniref:type IV pilin protein n=1 Tax=Synechococcus sp. UW106 TaxID=368495 RepID=UPI000E0E0C43|nr:prepilin-type N-terminal cleavage/methylation domain-containing protein [Synechococcus sp. UW106]
MKTPKRNINGFSLTELMAAVSIVGILSAIAIPNYSNQMERTKQNSMAASMEQLLIRIISSKEEIGLPPKTWKDLSNQAVIMTISGPISDDEGSLEKEIALSDGNYSTRRIGDLTDENYFILESTVSQSPERNVLGCIDLSTGASDVKLGIVHSKTSTKVETSDLICK